MKAGLDEGAANEIANVYRTTIEERDMRERIAGDFTLDDAAAVCLYTFDFGDDRYEMSPYDLLNRALRAEKNVVKEIVKVRDVLYLVMAITSGGKGCKDPAPNLTAQKAPSLSSGDGGCWRLFVLLVGWLDEKAKTKN